MTTWCADRAAAISCRLEETGRCSGNSMCACGAAIIRGSDMGADYRGIRALWLALCLFVVAWPARSDTIRIGALNLTVDSSWRRPAADSERGGAGVTLRRSEYGAELEVFFPRRPVPLASTPGEFFRQMDRGWHDRYGSQA